MTRTSVAEPGVRGQLKLALARHAFTPGPHGGRYREGRWCAEQRPGSAPGRTRTCNRRIRSDLQAVHTVLQRRKRPANRAIPSPKVVLVGLRAPGPWDRAWDIEPHPGPSEGTRGGSWPVKLVELGDGGRCLNDDGSTERERRPERSAAQRAPPGTAPRSGRPPTLSQRHQGAVAPSQPGGPRPPLTWPERYPGPPRSPRPDGARTGECGCRGVRPVRERCGVAHALERVQVRIGGECCEVCK